MALTRSEIMSRIRSKNTGPERRFRRLLRLLGAPSHLEHHGEFKIDFAWPGLRVAVFVDGCLWHGCPAHYREPKTNAAFWRSKVERNAARDRLATLTLATEGWRVVRLWEHDVKKMRAPEAAALLHKAGVLKTADPPGGGE